MDVDGWVECSKRAGAVLSADSGSYGGGDGRDPKARNDGQTAMLGLFETVECILHSTAVSGDGSRSDCRKLVYRNSLPSLNE